MEADEALVELASIEEQVGLIPNALVQRKLKAFGTELLKLFYREEIPV